MMVFSHIGDNRFHMHILRIIESDPERNFDLTII